MNDQLFWTVGMSLATLEELAIKKAYGHFRGNKTATANALGIAIRTLDSKLERYVEEEHKHQEAIENERQRRADFLERSRGTPPAQFGLSTGWQSTPESTFGLAMEPAFRNTENENMPMSKREDSAGLLSKDSVQVRHKRSRS